MNGDARGQGMSKPDYRSRVDVLRRSTGVVPEPVADLQGVTLAHAVEVVMNDWPVTDREHVLIATKKGFLRFADIRAIFARSDFPS